MSRDNSYGSPRRLPPLRSPAYSSASGSRVAPDPGNFDVRRTTSPRRPVAALAQMRSLDDDGDRGDRGGRGSRGGRSGGAAMTPPRAGEGRAAFFASARKAKNAFGGFHTRSQTRRVQIAAEEEAKAARKARVDSQNLSSLRWAVDETKHVPYAQQIGIFYSLAFFNMLGLVYLTLEHPDIVPYVYVAEVLPLVFCRIIWYYRKAWHHYCLDFCYLGNVLCIIYICFVPHDDRLFLLVFACCNGIVLSGAFPFFNRACLDDWDKVTSVYIHWMPPFVTYVIALNARAQAPAFARYDVCKLCTPEKVWTWMIGISLVVFFAHQMVLTFWVHIVPHRRLHQRKGYQNSYIFVERRWSKTPGLKQWLDACGKKRRLVMYNVTNIIYACLCLLPTILYFYYRWVHFGMLAAALAWTTYHGGRFYALSAHQSKVLYLLSKQTAKSSAEEKRFEKAAALASRG